MEQIVKFNDWLMHLPAGGVVILFAIAIGYVFKASNFFPNTYIPSAVIAICLVAFPVVQLCADLAVTKPHPFLSIPMNCLLGVILGFFAWTFHAQILKRWVDPLFSNQNPPTNPPANQ